MLSTLLLLAAAPQTVVPPMPAAPPVPGNEARMRVIDDAGPGCAGDLRQANVPTSPGGGLMWREGGEAVGLYRLLDRRVNGCPAPIIVNYRVPGSNAVGREATRAPEAAPVIVRRP